MSVNVRRQPLRCEFAFRKIIRNVRHSSRYSEIWTGTPVQCGGVVNKAIYNRSKRPGRTTMALVSADELLCGTAMSYKFIRNRNDQKEQPLIWACLSDFMILPSY